MTTKTADSPPSTSGYCRLPTRLIRTVLAEDSPVMMLLLARALENDKRILIVGSGSDGRKALGYASSLRPDLVITDLHMPGPKGDEITRLLKQQRHPPIILVVTSDDSAAARARCAAAGADAFLVKSANLALQIRSAIQKFFPAGDAKPDELCEELATAG